MELKKLVAVVVFCAASIAMAQIDYDLVATIPGGSGTDTILTNTGDDAIEIMAIGFQDSEGHITASGFANGFEGFMALGTSNDELSLISLGAPYSMPAGEVINLGVISSGDHSVWQQDFGIAGGVVAYMFYIPEPASMSLLGIGALALLRRRK